MGITEQGAKVATDAIDALKSQPVLLGLLILQFTVLGVVLWGSISRQHAMTEQFKLVFALLEKCLEK